MGVSVGCTCANSYDSSPSLITRMLVIVLGVVCVFLVTVQLCVCRVCERVYRNRLQHLHLTGLSAALLRGGEMWRAHRVGAGGQVCGVAGLWGAQPCLVALFSCAELRREAILVSLLGRKI